MLDLEVELIACNELIACDELFKVFHSSFLLTTLLSFHFDQTGISLSIR